jgi:hypothetical protein
VPPIIPNGEAPDGGGVRGSSQDAELGYRMASHVKPVTHYGQVLSATCGQSRARSEHVRSEVNTTTDTDDTANTTPVDPHTD